MLLLVGALAAASQLTLDSDGTVTRARSAHASLMVMLHTKYDHASSLAVPMFRTLVDRWGSTNVTFAFADAEATPELANALIGDSGSLPAYALFLHGIGAPVRYSGGWSDKSIGSWLHKQTAMRPVEARTVAEVQAAVNNSAHGIALVGFLTEAQRQRKLLEVAARAAQAPAAVVLGDSELATALLGATASAAPCIVVVRRDATRWPVLSGALTQRAVEAFARERAMPALVSIGDSARSFSQQVRNHPLQVHVLLFHRSGQQGPHAPSDEALETMRLVAERHDGEALFLAYDFFDNDPDAFSAHKVSQSQLPIALAVHGRGGFNERTWRLPPGSGGEGGIFEEELERLVGRALGELSADSSAGALTASEQQRMVDTPEHFHEQQEGHDEL